MKQQLLAYDLLKETVTAIMILFDIIAGVLQESALAPYLFVICQDYLLRTSIDLMKENGFT